MAQTVLQQLLAGNQRFVANKSTLDDSSQRRITVAHGQHPVAAVFSCVDARVPPELIFDQDLGRLMVIRTAGQVIDKAVLGSLEFAVAEFQVPLIVVLGHGQCGALHAAMASLTKPAAEPDQIAFLVEALAPAVRLGQRAGGDLWQQAVEAQIRRTVAHLRLSPVLSEAVVAGRLEIVGACYSLESGLVQLISA